MHKMNSTMVSLLTLVSCCFVVVFGQHNRPPPDYYNHETPAPARPVSDSNGCSLVDTTEYLSSYDDTCYEFVMNNDVRTWQEARDSCLAKGGQLVVIPDSGTQRFLVQTMDNFHERIHYVWIGVSNFGRDWYWVNGDRVDRYSNWPEGLVTLLHILDHGDCGQMDMMESGLWVQAECTEQSHDHPYICEYDVSALSLLATSTTQPTTTTSTSTTTPTTSTASTSSTTSTASMTSTTATTSTASTTSTTSTTSTAATASTTSTTATTSTPTTTSTASTTSTAAMASTDPIVMGQTDSSATPTDTITETSSETDAPTPTTPSLLELTSGASSQLTSTHSLTEMTTTVTSDPSPIEMTSTGTSTEFSAEMTTSLTSTELPIEMKITDNPTASTGAGNETDNTMSAVMSEITSTSTTVQPETTTTVDYTQTSTEQPTTPSAVSSPSPSPPAHVYDSVIYITDKPSAEPKTTDKSPTNGSTATMTSPIVTEMTGSTVKGAHGNVNGQGHAKATTPFVCSEMNCGRDCANGYSGVYVDVHGCVTCKCN